MSKDRMIVDFETPEDAKKVEETVKTGYAESAVETVIHWIAAEGDLRETYARLAGGSDDPRTRETYEKLRAESEGNLTELARLLKSLESLDRARVSRIDLLSSILV